MTSERPDRVISIDWGALAPVTGTSIDAAIAGLHEGVGRVEVAPADRVRTPNDARALDLQNNGFAVHAMRHGVINSGLGYCLQWGYLTFGGLEYPNYVHVAGNRVRIRITAAEWNVRPDELVDAPFYLFSPEAEQFGTEAWQLGDGVEKWPARDGMPDAYEVWLATGKSLQGKPADFPLYVSAEHFDVLYEARG